MNPDIEEPQAQLPAEEAAAETATTPKPEETATEGTGTDSDGAATGAQLAAEGGNDAADIGNEPGTPTGEAVAA